MGIKWILYLTLKVLHLIVTTRGPQYITKAACCSSQVLVVTISLRDASLYPSLFFWSRFSLVRLALMRCRWLRTVVLRILVQNWKTRCIHSLLHRHICSAVWTAGYVLDENDKAFCLFTDERMGNNVNGVFGWSFDIVMLCIHSKCCYVLVKI